MKREKKSLNDKGVSETVGFMIILAIMITGIGLVTLYGYPALLSQQDEANIRNMEKNMIVLQSDLDGLAFKNIPYDEEAFQVTGGVLSVKNPADTPPFQIHTDAGDLPLFYPGEIHFESESGNTIIAISNGAVVKRYNGQTGSIMLSQPRWFVDEDPITGKITLVIPFIRVHAPSEFATNGISTVRMQMSPGTTLTQIDNPSEIIVRYIPGTENNIFPTAWSNFVSGEDLKMDVNPGVGTTYEFSYPGGEVHTLNADGSVDTLIIKEYDINILGL